MDYYYDIKLNFNDYYLPYYEWSNKDTLDRLIRVPIYKVSNIEYYINNVLNIDSKYKYIIVTDSINAVCLELVDNKSIYISSLCYLDEISICSLAKNMEETSINSSFVDKRMIKNKLRIEESITNKFINYINKQDDNYIKYLYNKLFNKNIRDINKAKSIIIDDIQNNFDVKYIKLYKKIIK